MVAEIDRKSKKIENIIRFLVLKSYCLEGLDRAMKFLEGCQTCHRFLAAIGDDQLKKNCCGVSGELDFLASLGDKYRLIPTLDAGCQFDFIGCEGGKAICVDVTKGKSDKGAGIEAYGPFAWPVRVAHVKYRWIDWYRREYDELVDAEMNIDEILPAEVWPSSSGLESLYAPSLDFFLARHECLYAVARHGASGACLEKIAGYRGVTQEERDTLRAQMVFFNNYKGPLNLVPTLSVGDCIDFVGQMGSQLVCYCVVPQTASDQKKRHEVLCRQSQTKGKETYLAEVNLETSLVTFKDELDFL